MSIKYALLGFLSETPLTGYDLKKRFSASEIFHWSGNNNQIYRALVELHDEGLVSVDVQQQVNKPPRKVYTITEVGRAALRAWIGVTPEPPQIQHALLEKLTWADQFEPELISAMLTSYAEDLRVYLLMLREREQRNAGSPLQRRIAEHWQSFYQSELDWVSTLRHSLER
jgi:DNA-binding PadR family transcriptional regulator